MGGLVRGSSQSIGEWGWWASDLRYQARGALFDFAGVVGVAEDDLLGGLEDAVWWPGGLVASRRGARSGACRIRAGWRWG